MVSGESSEGGEGSEGGVGSEGGEAARAERGSMARRGLLRVFVMERERVARVVREMSEIMRVIRWEAERAV